MKRCGISCARGQTRPEHPSQASVEGLLAPPGPTLSGTPDGRGRIAGGSRISVFRWRRNTSRCRSRDTIDETERRVERLTDQLRQQTPAWRWAPVVDALQALRGVSFVTAVGLVVEVGDIRRFDHPRQLMAFLGLVPSEYSSGPSVRRGGITKAGNPHARRLLAEAAWAYQGVPRIGRQMLYRQEALPKIICDIAWKAQLRLTSRFRKLVARGQSQVVAAIARELTGFIWAIAREVPPPAA